MLRSLRGRLIAAFTFTIVLSLLLAGAAFIVLMREQQAAQARERASLLVEPVAGFVRDMEARGASQPQLADLMHHLATGMQVRLLLVDTRGQVLIDTAEELTGRRIEALEQPNSLPVQRVGVFDFRFARYQSGAQRLMLFLAPQERPAPSGRPPLPSRSVPTNRTVVVVPEADIRAAWLRLAPSLTVAGIMALLVSTAIAVLVSRSMSGRIARITRASEEMAQGRYDQQLQIQGDDEIGRLGRSFNQMAQQVSRSDRSMRELLANVSHELKTPLTSIQGFSQAMVEGALQDPADYAQAGRIVNEEAQRMRRLVDDLLYLSQIESGQVVMAREPVLLAPLLAACAERLQWQLKESGADLRLETPDLLPVAGDEHRLEQVFTNLLDNAVQHTPPGGRITVRASQRGYYVAVTVHNTGSIIAVQDLPHVFERFYRGDRARTHRNGQSGLGLAIVQEVVQAHGGSVSVQSTPDTGTEFTVVLPIGEHQNSAQRTTAESLGRR